MPHECVGCGELLDDGSADVFKGCPECGGTKFMYSKPSSPEPEEPQGVEQTWEGKEEIAMEREESESLSGSSEEVSKPEQVKQELSDQFESIRIIEPGNYQLNLKKLFDKDEKIIALQEDGRYKITVPSSLTS